MLEYVISFCDHFNFQIMPACWFMDNAAVPY